MKLKTYLISPYLVGSDKKSTAMVLPSKVVKTLRIDPTTTFLILKVCGDDELQLKIIKEEDLTKKEILPPALPLSVIEKVPMPTIQQQQRPETTTTSITHKDLNRKNNPKPVDSSSIDVHQQVITRGKI